MMISEERLSAIRSRVTQASPGPWSVGNAEHEENVAVDFVNGDPRLGAGSWFEGITAHGDDCNVEAGKRVAEANARFVAAARTDVEELLREVEGLQKAVRILATSLQEYREEDRKKRAVAGRVARERTRKRENKAKP